MRQNKCKQLQMEKHPLLTGIVWTVVSPLPVQAKPVQTLKTGDRDGIAALLTSFEGCALDSRDVLTDLLASLDFPNTSSPTEASARSYSSDGG
jgi:hypothetical protein